MNLALLNPRVWLEIACVALVAAAFWFVYVCGERSVQTKFDEYKLTQEHAALVQNETYRVMEQGLNLSLENLENAYIQKQSQLAAARVVTANSLRDFQSALSSSAAPDSAAARSTNASPGLESELLGDCAVALTKLANEADGLEAQVVGLQGYITTVLGKK